MEFNSRIEFGHGLSRKVVETQTNGFNSPTLLGHFEILGMPPDLLQFRGAAVNPFTSTIHVCIRNCFVKS